MYVAFLLSVQETIAEIERLLDLDEAGEALGCLIEVPFLRPVPPREGTED